VKTRSIVFALAAALILLGLLIWRLRGTDAPAPDAGPHRPSLPGDAADEVLPRVLDALAACGHRAQPACTGAGQLSFQIVVERDRGRVGQLKIEPAVLAPAVETCAREAIRKLEFGRSMGSGTLEVLYPLACRDGQLHLPHLADRSRTRPADIPPKPVPSPGDPDQQAK